MRSESGIRKSAIAQNNSGTPRAYKYTRFAPAPLLRGTLRERERGDFGLVLCIIHIVQGRGRARERERKPTFALRPSTACRARAPDGRRGGGAAVKFLKRRFLSA